MIPTSVNGPGSAQTATTATTGIASLILEGRALSDDDYVMITATNPARLEYQSRRVTDERKLPAYLTSRPSNLHNTTFDFNYVYSSNSGEASTSDPTLQHMQRLRQKLGQLRQSSPSTSRGEQLSAEQAIAIGLNNRCNNSLTSPEEVDDGDNELVKYLQRKQPINKFVNPITVTLQSLATTCLRTAAPRSSKGLIEPGEQFFNSTRLGGSAGSSYGGVKASTSGYGSENFIPKTIKTPPTRSSDRMNAPKQGPHCDQFLRKVGLIKADPLADVEEHICDMANLHEICFLWQLHCRQIDFIMSTMDPICIEVYLGPENHEILLEQWIIQQKEKSTTPTMTLQSLLNAIRSQLYFSQITAWTDLIKNAKPNDRDIIEHGRIKLVEKVENGATIRTPRLDIFYRIRAYDATACFNSKPNVHDFPNVVISENCSISVCLKSLPRIQNGIPRINFVENENTNNPNNTSCNSSNNNNNSNCSHNTCPASAVASSSSVASDSSTDQSNSSVDESMVLDDRLNFPCQEKGKHRCAFDEEYGNSDALVEEMVSAEQSHREKQLLKYRKRMMKRDKKTKMASGSSGKVCNETAITSLSTNSPPKPEQFQQQHIQPEHIKQGCNGENHLKSTNYQPLHHHQPSIPEFGSINSYRPPLYCTQETTVAEGVQTNSVEMVSIGTQTPNFPFFFPSCENCGHKMEFTCLHCVNNTEKHTEAIVNDSCQDEMDGTFSSANGSSSPPEPPKLGKGDLLLQAIVRTPRHRFYSDTRNNNNNILTSNLKNPPQTKTNDCQLCKRQKTQHVYRNSPQAENNMSMPCANEQNGYKFAKSYFASASDANESVDRHMSVDCACLDEYAENCCIKSNTLDPHPSPDKLLSRTSVNSAELKLCENIDAQFKTPKTAPIVSNQSSPKNHHKPTPLFINCSGKLPPHKSIPKINLTNIFSDSPSTSCASAPIPILSSDVDGISAAFSFDNINNSPDIPVQKSSSAPTLPNSPSLSPRFLKQAAIYKRRSRHLSDRSSERSSIGSDEQFSDEDLESLYSPTSSPVKTRLFLKSSGFGRRPILGSFEESLFQKRFVPKSQAAGYKVLLGASGGFCPTQLTIPAIASFYELPNASTLSTPYVCEIRLSRKGYTVPRVGTIQATLLNPLGTVVRMFVVPYDFRDMPAMSQTFIRQRILAVDASSVTSESIESSTGSTSPAVVPSGNLSGLDHKNVSHGEQMRTLRYAIHLRFQTTRSGRLALHTDIRLLISRRTDCDTAAAHAKGALESPNELRIVTIKPENPKYSARQENPNKI